MTAEESKHEDTLEPYSTECADEEEPKQQHGRLGSIVANVVIAVVVILLLSIVIQKVVQYMRTKETVCTVTSDAVISEQTCYDNKCSSSSKRSKKKKCRKVAYKCFNYSIGVEFQLDDESLVKSFVKPVSTFRFLDDAKKAVQKYTVCEEKNNGLVVSFYIPRYIFVFNL
mgnify:CR=1 FL=1